MSRIEAAFHLVVVVVVVEREKGIEMEWKVVDRHRYRLAKRASKPD